MIDKLCYQLLEQLNNQNSPEVVYVEEKFSTGNMAPKDFLDEFERALQKNETTSAFGLQSVSDQTVTEVLPVILSGERVKLIKIAGLDKDAIAAVMDALKTNGNHITELEISNIDPNAVGVMLQELPNISGLKQLILEPPLVPEVHTQIDEFYENFHNDNPGKRLPELQMEFGSDIESDLDDGSDVAIDDEGISDDDEKSEGDPSLRAEEETIVANHERVNTVGQKRWYALFADNDNDSDNDNEPPAKRAKHTHKRTGSNNEGVSDVQSGVNTLSLGNDSYDMDAVQDGVASMSLGNDSYDMDAVQDGVASMSVT